MVAPDGFPRAILKLTTYYVIVGAVGWGLTLLYPPLVEAFSGERLSELAQRGLIGGGDPVGVGSSTRGPVDSLLFTFFALSGLS